VVRSAEFRALETGILYYKFLAARLNNDKAQPSVELQRASKLCYVRSSSTKLRSTLHMAGEFSSGMYRAQPLPFKPMEACLPISATASTGVTTFSKSLETSKGPEYVWTN
jgi:hypothetical protein